MNATAAKVQALTPDNLPSAKEERWKYTNIVRAMPDGLRAEDQSQKEVIHIPRGKVCEEVVEILFTGRDNTRHSPELEIVLEQGAQATIVERHDGQGEYWQNMKTEIRLEAGAILHHIRIMEGSEDSLNTNMVAITADRDSGYYGFALNMNGKFSRHEIDAKLNGAGAHIGFDGLNLLKGKQHGDTTILITHGAPNCTSNQFYRTLLDDHAKCVFQGKVFVEQIAQKTDGYQLSNAILLSDKAEMDTKPELEIYADDVKCSHGATTGQLDEEPLFYLRSRGLSESEARRLLLESFIAEVAAKIDNETLQEQISEKASSWLLSILS